MQIGDLVKPLLCCGGTLGDHRCESALILEQHLSHHEQVEVGNFEYADVEVYEYKLLCGCGTFEEYEDRLDLISASR